jgi:hypothetical protein
MPAHRRVFLRAASILVAASMLAATSHLGYAGTPTSWPPSSQLLLAEVVTGGASASDEYAEIANAGPISVDLGGCELVYATATGATTTRKALFVSPLLLDPGRHLLVANGAGIYGPLADATYTGGFAADGGSLALRCGDGTVIDAVGWGTATNAYREGSAAPAPPARSSIERRPGADGGNVQDTNDNATDWLVQSNPVPQSLVSAPVPGAPSETPSPSPAASGTAEATATTPSGSQPATPEEPSPTPSTPAASQSPELTASQEPTTEPSVEPSVSPATSPIASVRTFEDGSHVTVQGVLTTRLGVLDGGRGGFVQDGSAGISLYLPQVPTSPLPAETLVLVMGTVSDRYGQRTIRVDEGGLAVLGEALLPEAPNRSTGSAGELDEGSRIGAVGVLTTTPDALADGTGLWIDDGSGPLRVVATVAALEGITLRKGLSFQVVGPLGQHISGSSSSYRIEATEQGSVLALVDDTPSASLSPTASAQPSAKSAPTPSPTGTPTSSPTDPEVDLESIAAARQQAVGTRVNLAGVVTVGPGRLGTDELVAIQDSSGGIFVRLTAPDGLEVGRSIEVVGILAAPYGQLEVRQLQTLILGPLGPQPSTTTVQLIEIGEDREGTLATVHGTVDSVQADSGRLSLAIGDGQSVLRVFADPRTGLTTSDVKRGSNVVVTGVVGQRATALGRQDGYRLWLRTRADLTIEQGSAPGASEGPSPSPTASGTAIRHDLASALGLRGSVVDVTATVTASAGLIDWGGPTIVVDDGTAACAVVVPAGTDAIRVGSRVHLAGKVGSWKSGPRIVATLVQTMSELQATEPHQVVGALTARQEWQLVQASGRIDRLIRVGVRWRADLLVAGRSVAILGEPAAGIAASNVLQGHMAVIVGIVRRSTSNSGEFELLPRSPLDLRLGPSPDSPAVQPGWATPRTSASAATATRDDISSLPGRLGQPVVVSGLVVDAEDGSVTLDDGTGRVRLGGKAAAEAISLLEPGDAVEVGGLVQRDAQGWLIEVDPSSIVALSAVGDAPRPSAAATESRPADRAATMQPKPLASGPPGLAPWLVMVVLVLAAGFVGAFSIRRRGSLVAWMAGLRKARPGRNGAPDGPKDAF